MNRDSLRLYAVTPSGLGEAELLEKVRAGAKAGITFLQLREKGLGTAALAALAKKVKKITDEYKIPFVVNDDTAAALAAGADGVHLGQGDEGARAARGRLGAGKVLGISVQTVGEALIAEARGADYLGVGAVFPTISKADAGMVSLGTLREICASVKIPVVAIGGITRENIGELSGSGVSGVALISALFGAADIGAAAKSFLGVLNKKGGVGL